MIAVAIRVLRTIDLLRLTPFDRATEEGRARERHRRVILTAFAAAAAKVISVVSLLISIPLTLAYLGAERYGMWVTIGSLIAMMSFADLGIGNGLLNVIADSHGRDDRQAMRRHISSAYTVLAAITLLILVALAASYNIVPWHKLFNVQSELARAEAGPALAVFVCCFAFNIPLSIVQRTQVGLQQGFTANLWQCAGSILGLTGILFAISVHASLPWLVAAAIGLPMLAAIGNTLLFFGRQRCDLSPKPALSNRESVQRIAHTGALFFVLQLIAAIAYMSDNLVISHVIGADSVAQYAVPEKMFAVIGSVLMMAIAPLWPAYGEAIARGDKNWSRRTLIQSLWFATATSGTLSLILIWLGPWLLTIWVGHSVAVSLPLLVALGVWKTLDSIGNTLSMYLNGRSMLRIQVILGIAMATTAIALKIVLVEHFGIAGTPIATAIAYSICILVPLAWLFPRLLEVNPEANSKSQD